MNLINTLRLDQNLGHFGRCCPNCFCEWNSLRFDWIFNEACLVSNCQIDDNSLFVQVMAWRLFGTNQSPEQILTMISDAVLPQYVNAHRLNANHDDVMKWKHFPRYWPFVRGIHQSPVNSLHKGQWRGALMFSLICARINGWVNNGGAGDLRRYRAHYDVIVMNGTLWYVQ